MLDRKFSAQFRLEQARAFAWGQQPTIANFLPGNLVERKEEMEFVLKLARVRRRALPYLRDGTFLRPPAVGIEELTIPMSRLSIYAGQRDAVKGYAGKAQKMLASAWASLDGGLAAALVNISEGPVALPLSLGPPDYLVPRSGVIRKITDSGTADIGSFSDGRASWRAELGPAEACVYEIAPRQSGMTP